MSEAEYNQLLDVVGMAVADGGQDNTPRPVITLRRAANDNEVEWTLLPFPSGWNASC